MELQVIQNKIYEVRGQKVMLDFDLASIYEVETKALNQAVKRNIERFPEDFMFRLTLYKWELLRSQFVTLENTGKGKHSKYLPFAFTEHGVTMLSSVLKSERAVKMSIAVVKAFIAMKKFALQYGEVVEQIQELKEIIGRQGETFNERIGEHDVQLSRIYDTIENLLDQKVEEKKWEERERIGFRK